MIDAPLQAFFVLNFQDKPSLLPVVELRLLQKKLVISTVSNQSLGCSAFNLLKIGTSEVFKSFVSLMDEWLRIIFSRAAFRSLFCFNSCTRRKMCNQIKTIGISRA
jgi:hypothetical protein